MKKGFDNLNEKQEVKLIKAHGLTWIYYKTIGGDYRFISPKSGQDRGPFQTKKAMRDYILTFGGNVNWQ